VQALVNPPDAAPPTPLEETRETLLAAARRRFGPIPPDFIVEHVLRVTVGADFPVREAALAAVERRWGFAQRDALVVASRPEGGRALGAYTTARPPSRAGRAVARAPQPRPYRSVLDGLTPLTCACDCPDFLRSSLGVCKHLLVVLADLHGKPRRLALALRESVGAAASRRARLHWEPTLALTGGLDRLSGLRLVLQGVGVELPSGARFGRLRRSFPRGAPDETVLHNLDRRRDLLVLLQAIMDESTRGIDISPAARAIVAEELDRAARRVRNVAAATDGVRELRSLKRRLYPYQKHGVERALECGRLLLADDMGLGKTTQAIATCHALFRSGRVVRGLVIAPASLKVQWLREWQDTTDVPASIVDGAPSERLKQYRGLRRGFLILNYEQLLRDADAIQALRPEMVVLDEAQRIKNWATKSAVYVKALSPEFRLVLTGTPMENRLEELASILDWVDDVALSPKWRLVPWYTRWEGDGGKGKVGARNLDTLRSRLGPCVLRRVRREVLAQLPPRTDTRVPVELTPQQAEAHGELNVPIARLLRVARSRPLAQAEFLKLMSLLTQQRIIANGLGQLHFERIWPAYCGARPDATLFEGLFAPKLAELRRLIADLVLTQKRKVVVFSQWRRMLRLAEWSVRDVLEDEGLRAVFFTGAEKQSQRTRNIVDFHDDARVAVMFLSDAGGVGLNLQKAASVCINLELPWNPAVLEQRIGRIYRLGQKQPIDVYNLVSEGSIEARIAGLVGAKQALFAGLFDGTSDEIRFDAAASFLTRVERLVDLAPAPEAPVSIESAESADGDTESPPAQAEAALEDAALADADSEAAPSRAYQNGSAPTPSANALSSLFESLRVERTSNGGVRIEAPPQAAESLVALFQGMAKLLGAAADPPSP
jgi:SNF2-related domain/Helicase conserved C-terminal domain